MQLIFLHGPPASGKHTIGTRLSELTGLPLFHNHLVVDAAKCLFAFGTSSFNTLRATIWREVFKEAAAMRRSFIFTFNPEASVDPAIIESMCESITAVGGAIHFIELVCDRATLLERLPNPSRAVFGKLTDPELFQHIEAQQGFDFPALPPPMLVIDTTLNSADSAAAQVAQALQNQKLTL